MFKEQTMPSDVVVVILSLLGEGKIIPSNKNFLYEKFFELSKSLPVIFQDFIFNESKIYPYCETVDIAINRITKFELVEWKTLEGDYVILPSLVEKGKKLMELFNMVEIIQLSNVSEKFKEMINNHYGAK